MGGCISKTSIGNQQPQQDNPPQPPSKEPIVCDDEYQHWMSKIEQAADYIVEAHEVLKDAPYHIRNNKKIVMAAVQKYSFAFEYASPSLQNDKGFVMDIVKIRGYALMNASPSLQNDIEVAMAAVTQSGYALRYASPSLRNDKEFVMDIVKINGEALMHASPSLQNDIEVVMTAVTQNGYALEFASPLLRNDKRVVMTAVSENGVALQYSSPSLQNDKRVVMTAVSQIGLALQYASPNVLKDKEIALFAVEKNPDVIKYIHKDLKRDSDVMIAAGLYDKNHADAIARPEMGVSKIVLSTRFSLDASSKSQATKFNALFKKSKYVQEGNFVVYAPNAFDKKTCDPKWTSFDHPCRGTKDTCKGWLDDASQYRTNVLTKDGHPTGNCCWRYSFRSQLQEAKNTGGFMVQLVETDPSIPFGQVKDAKLGNGQRIELDMANTIGLKVFQVYVPHHEDKEMFFRDLHIDVVTNQISSWYNKQCQDMSVTVIRQPLYQDQDMV